MKTKSKKKLAKPATKFINSPKIKVSKVWLATLEAAKNPGKIVDMRAVLR